MMVMPWTCAFTSSRRFTLLKLFSAAAILPTGMPQELAERRGCGRVPDVIFSRQCKSELCPALAIVLDGPLRVVRI